MNNLFSRVRIVLLNTSHPGNIGSTARAMKTMGFKDLVLVKPKQFPHAKAIEMAAGADDLLATARVVSSLPEALSGAQLVFGTSARLREIALPEVSPKGAVQCIQNAPQDSKIAILFGNEQSGLSNQELSYANYQLFIPASEQYASLNLSQAVQIVCYELRSSAIDGRESSPTQSAALACSEEMQHFYEHLSQVLVAVDFLREDVPKRLLPRIKRLFNRLQLEASEVRLLRGFLSRIEKKLTIQESV